MIRKLFQKNSNSLIDYCKKNDFCSVFKLLKNSGDPYDINLQDKNGWTPIHFSSKNGNSKLTNLLIYYECEIDVEDNEKKTPLMIACENGHTEIVILLTVAGANINAANKIGNTPLHYSFRKGNKKIIDFLLSKPSIFYDRPNIYDLKPIDFTNDKTLITLYENHIEIKNKLVLQNHRVIENAKENYQKIDKKDFDSSTITLSQSNTENNNKRIDQNSFDFLKLIGKGSFGKVYLAKSKENGKLFAIKLIEKSTIIKQNYVRYAVSERNVLSIIKNPFLVKLFSAFQTQDKLCLVLEYYKHGDLGKLLDKYRKIPEDIVKIYAAQIVLAVEALHNRDIIFRDLKPENIVINLEGHIALTDFGLSKEGVYSCSTGGKSFCGSVAYLAPEMIKKQGHGKAVDWYGLGVVIYEMLIGIPPFYDKEKLQINASISKDAKKIIYDLLEKNPAKRLGSGILDSEEIKAHPYFSNINWNEINNRKVNVLEMYKKYKMNLPEIEIENENNIDVFNGKAEYKTVKNWTFICDDNL